jgi:nitroreductase
MKPYDPAVVTWEIDEQDFPRESSLREQMKFLLGYAILAPSSHNTQPWKFALGDEGVIEVRLDPAGWLRIADADQRELYLSLGCALENLLVAAGHFGFAAEPGYFPDPRSREVVARVTLKKAAGQTYGRHSSLFQAITLRQTIHQTFDRRPVELVMQQRIRQCCDEPGIHLYLTDDDQLRRQVDELIVRSDARLFANPDYREELAYWIGQGVFGTPWLISQLGRLAMAYLNFGGMVTRNDEQALMSAPLMAVLVADENDRVSQLRAGQVFERIYLTGALLGIGVRPMSQIVQVPEHKKELAQLFSLSHGVPLQPFLLGHAEPDGKHTPRKTVTEVLVG